MWLATWIVCLVWWVEWSGLWVSVSIWSNQVLFTGVTPESWKLSFNARKSKQFPSINHVFVFRIGSRRLLEMQQFFRLACQHAISTVELGPYRDCMWREKARPSVAIGYPCPEFCSLSRSSKSFELTMPHVEWYWKGGRADILRSEACVYGSQHTNVF